MSRDAHSYDPHDAGETRDTSTRRTVPSAPTSISDTREGRNRGPEALSRGDIAEAREQHRCSRRTQ